MAKSRGSSKTLLPKELTTVTPLSRMLAYVAFIVIPFIAFFWGMNYQNALNGAFCMSNVSLVQPLHIDFTKVTPQPVR